MKTPLTLTLVGVVCGMMASCCCGTSGRETIYVTTKSGAPISGAQLIPNDVPAGCPCPVRTNECGAVRLPGDAVYSIRKDGFRPVYGVQQSNGGSQHVIMETGWPN